MSRTLFSARVTHPAAIARLVAGAVLVACLFAVTVAPNPAAARPSQKKGIWGPVTVNGVSQFPIYRDLGAGVFWTRCIGV